MDDVLMHACINGLSPCGGLSLIDGEYDGFYSMGKLRFPCCMIAVKIISLPP